MGIKQENYKQEELKKENYPTVNLENSIKSKYILGTIFSFLDEKIKLEFEGEYLNGERNGKGKEYNHQKKLKFEGEYLNGKKKWKRN